MGDTQDNQQYQDPPVPANNGGDVADKPNDLLQDEPDDQMADSPDEATP